MIRHDIRLFEPNVPFLPSTVINRVRYRAFGAEVYCCDLEETFHEFLENYAKRLLGDKWWAHQKSMKEEQQSSLFRHASVLGKLKAELYAKNASKDGYVVIPHSGPILSWMSFCYDLLCLTNRFSLPESLIEKLLDNKYFQSTKYEIAIAAVLMRAGCDIDWIDPAEFLNRSSCEFFATHKRTSTQFAVEAKSKHRPGVHNEKGIYDEKQGLGNITRLFRDGIKKDSNGLPLMLFVDINLPSPESLEKRDEMLKNQFGEVIRKFKFQQEIIPERLCLSVFTNFPFHYGKDNFPSPPASSFFIFPYVPKIELPEGITNDIARSLDRYGLIPMEI